MHGDRANELAREFDVRTPIVMNDIGNLSGGNQQKVIVAREFSRPIKLLVAAQPTRGLDVGSIEYIHKRIVAKRDEGAAVLIVSTELDEVLALGDRIAVMFQGRIVDILDPSEATPERLGLLMGGAHPEEGIVPVASRLMTEPQLADRHRRRPRLRRPSPREARAGPAGRRRWRQLLVPLLAVFTALVIGAFVIVLSDPDVHRQDRIEPWSRPRPPGVQLGVAPPTPACSSAPSGQPSTRSASRCLAATPLILAGLAVALGFRAGLFNIGAEGQIYVGGLFATAVGINFQGLPLFVHLPLAVAWPASRAVPCGASCRGS